MHRRLRDGAAPRKQHRTNNHIARPTQRTRSATPALKPGCAVRATERASRARLPSDPPDRSARATRPSDPSKLARPARATRASRPGPPKRPSKPARLARGHHQGQHGRARTKYLVRLVVFVGKEGIGPRRPRKVRRSRPTSCDLACLTGGCPLLRPPPRACARSTITVGREELHDEAPRTQELVVEKTRHAAASKRSSPAAASARSKAARAAASEAICSAKHGLLPPPALP